MDSFPDSSKNDKPLFSFLEIMMGMVGILGVGWICSLHTIDVAKNYYAKNLPTGDALFLLNHLHSLLLAMDHGESISIFDSDMYSGYSIWPTLFTLVFNPWLPRDSSIAIYLHLPFYLILGISSYLLLLHRFLSPLLAFSWTLFLLTLPVPLAFPTHGLTDASLNLAGYLLGGSILALALCERCLYRLSYTLAIGILGGILALTRIFSAGQIAVGLLPCFFTVLLRSSPADRSRMLRGLSVAGGTALLISSPWLWEKWEFILGYIPRHYGKSGVIGVGDLFSSFRSYAMLLRWVGLQLVGPSLPLLLAVLLWWGWRVQWRRKFPHLLLPSFAAASFVGVVLGILLLLHSYFWPYAWPILPGLFFFCLLPAGDQPLPLLPSKRFRGILAFLALLHTFSFLRLLEKEHSSCWLDRQSCRTLLCHLVKDLERNGTRPVTLALADGGALGIFYTIHVALVDLRLPVIGHMLPPRGAKRGEKYPSHLPPLHLPTSLTFWPTEWKQRYPGATLDQSVEAYAATIEAMADFVVLRHFQEGEEEGNEDNRFYAALERRLCHSGYFQPWGPPCVATHRRWNIRWMDEARYDRRPSSPPSTPLPLLQLYRRCPPSEE